MHSGATAAPQVKWLPPLRQVSLLMNEDGEVAGFAHIEVNGWYGRVILAKEGHGMVSRKGPVSTLPEMQAILESACDLGSRDADDFDDLGGGSDGGY